VESESVSQNSIAAEMHATAYRHHFSFINEEAQCLDGQLMFQLQLLAVESFEAFLGLVEPHLQVLDGVLDGYVRLDEAGLRLVTAEFNAWSAGTVLKAGLDQLQCSDSLLDGLAKVCDVILHLRDLFLHLQTVSVKNYFKLHASSVSVYCTAYNTLVYLM